MGTDIYAVGRYRSQPLQLADVWHGTALDGRTSAIRDARPLACSPLDSPPGVVPLQFGKSNAVS